MLPYSALHTRRVIIIEDYLGEELSFLGHLERVTHLMNVNVDHFGDKDYICNYLIMIFWSMRLAVGNSSATRSSAIINDVYNLLEFVNHTLLPHNSDFCPCPDNEKCATDV